jgi:hypothetical protein
MEYGGSLIKRQESGLGVNNVPLTLSAIAFTMAGFISGLFYTLAISSFICPANPLQAVVPVP